MKLIHTSMITITQKLVKAIGDSNKK